MKRFILVLLPCLILVPIFYVAAISIVTVKLTRQIPIYRSVATLEFPLPQKDESEQHYQLRMRNQIVFLLKTEIVSKTARNINLSREAGDRLQSISAEPIEGTSLVKLTVDSLDSVLGAQYANSWATTFLDSLTPEERAGYKITERAQPAAYPITPRKLQNIKRAAYTGVSVGLIAALLLASLITLTMNRRMANKALQATRLPGRQARA